MKIRLSLLICAVAAIACCLLGTAGFRLTWSGSVPRGLYLAVDRPVERGSIVVACLPEDVGRWAAGRGYLSPGSCPGEASPVGKPVVGVSRDVVLVDAGGISINGHLLRRSQRSPFDSAGRPMPWVGSGEHRLDAGEIWIHSAHHPRSLDSRVYGPIPVENVREVLVPIWVEDSR